MQMTSDLELIDAAPQHMQAVLRLNEEFVQYLSPLNMNTLQSLRALADYFRVIEREGDVVAFLIAIAPGTDYDSPNYRWFDRKFSDFIYVDRIVVSGEARGFSLGTKLYNDLLEYARKRQFNAITCEYNVEPMNHGSAKFHKNYGFNEVAQQELAGGKIVSMQTYRIEE